MDDQVRTQAAVLGQQARLLVEVAAPEHAGDLDHPPELHFSPASTYRRRPERARQRVGGRAERQHLLGKPRVGLDALALGRGELLVHALERFSDRPLVPLEGHLRQVEERRPVVLERLGGERLEAVAKALLGGLEQLLGRGHRLPLALGVLARGLQLLARGGQVGGLGGACLGQPARGHVGHH